MKNKMDNFIRWLNKNNYKGENTQIYEFQQSGLVHIGTFWFVVAKYKSGLVVDWQLLHDVIRTRCSDEMSLQAGSRQPDN